MGTHSNFDSLKKNLGTIAANRPNATLPSCWREHLLHKTGLRLHANVVIDSPGLAPLRDGKVVDIGRVRKEIRQFLPLSKSRFREQMCIVAKDYNASIGATTERPRI